MAAPFDYLKQHEIKKCFKSVMGSLQDYMDKLIATIRLNEEITINAEDSEDFKVIPDIDTKFIAHLFNVSRDQHLKTPNKLKIIFNSPKDSEIKEIIKNYFDIRNELEHNKGIAKTDKLLIYKRFGLSNRDGKEININDAVDGDIINTTFDEIIQYDKGGNIIITKEQLEGMIMFVLTFAIMEMSNSVNRIISK
jgi:hypothetical protein